ncbi:eukaryotic translation initiation factor 2A, putative [Eimeria necatrix]|uniref:Eukaryotic translation initiation factor 2A n=1 Tax=Eimeria necatrix TaxID=51315 RepID=U6MD74_9EIME|nr:eukaryotic translation initiation factor 2A, putative [Eimeria necatrix]CDJ61986.1 eukaryotic translation initiation factor 2A, putative [Eimeria necatrix]
MKSEFIALTREGLELHNAALDEAGAFTVEKLRSIEGVESAEWSPQGDLVAIVRNSSREKVEILDATTWEVRYAVEGPTPVSKFSFSPLGRYLLICFRFEPTQCPENLRLIEVHSAKEVTRVAQRGVGELSWPPLRFTGGESFACRLVKGAVHVFSREQLESGSFSINSPLHRISSPRASAIFASPERPPSAAKDENSSSSSSSGNSSAYCAVFSKETKGESALLEVYELGQEVKCVAKKSFFQAQEAECHWAYDGRALLLKTHTDASDLTYYGSSALYFLRCQGGYDMRIVAADEGPVHAAVWSPSTIEFAVCYGKVPATVAVYDGNSKVTSPKFRMGEGMRTSLLFCPFAKLMLWGGFGNLAGEVEVWTLRKKGIVGKTVFFSLSGGLLKRVEFPCLYSVQFRPLSAAAAAAAAEAQKAIIDSLKVYQPGEAPLAPGAEGATKIGNLTSTGRSLSSLTQSRSGVPSVGAYKPPAARNATPRLPPGAAEAPAASNSPSKSARKRQNRKNKQEGAAQAEAAAEAGQDKSAEEKGSGAAEKDKRTETDKEQNAKQTTPAANATSDTNGSPQGEDEANDLRKAIRAVKKKLTEIERLKGRSDLNEMQQVKVSNEQKLKEELAELEKQFKSIN